MLINLKPRDARSDTASQIIRRLQRETASVQGITLYMQPAQDLTIDSTVSRTQYQFVLRDRQAGRFRRLGAAPDSIVCRRCRRSST